MPYIKRHITFCLCVFLLTVGSVSPVHAQEKIKPRPWWLFATFRTFYDDNVKLIPTKNVYNVGHEQSSFSESLFLKGGYIPIRAPNYLVNISYGFYANTYNSEHKFDVMDNNPGITFVYQKKMGPVTLRSKADYNFHWTDLNYNWWLKRHVAGPSLDVFVGSHFKTALSYNFQYRDFRTTPKYRANDRTGVRHTVGLTQFFRTADRRHHIKLGYYRTLDRTIGKNWDYNSNRLLGGIQFSLPEGLRLNVDYSWNHKKFLHDNIFFGKKRSDWDKRLKASLTKNITKYVSVFAQYENRNNNSNIELSNYNKNIYSLGIGLRY